MQPLYSFTVNTSVSGPHDYEACSACRDHMRWAAMGRGVSPLVIGPPFTDRGFARMGACEHCDYRRDMEHYHDRRGLSR
jgi:hypothetical protein